MILTLVQLACQQDPSLKQLNFDRRHRVFLAGVILRLVAEQCHRDVISKKVAFHRHH